MNINENHTSSASQAERILEWMKAGHAITPMEALEMFGCSRLAARIADIRKKGWNVYSEFVTTESGKRIKSYHLYGNTL